MKKLPRIVLAKPVIHCVLKIVWNDGYEGVVDLRPTIARGKIFSYLQKPKNFEKLRVSDYGQDKREWRGHRLRRGYASAQGRESSSVE
jgi:hypothetical protein